MHHILSLPTELIAQILDNLAYRDLLTCTQVCSDFKVLIKRTASLQYAIELAVRGQKDGCRPSAISSAERLQQLDKHTSAWKNLKWSREITIPMEDGGLWELFGGVLAQNTEDNQFIFWQLPSDLRGVKEKKWTLGPDFGFIVADFAFDPCQDLLVLVEGADAARSDYCIHLRTLSTGKPHPLAKETHLIFGYSDEGGDRGGSYQIQILGGVVAVLFDPDSFLKPQLVVWDWETGELLLDITKEDICSFSLLAEDYLVISLTDEYTSPVLVVMQFPGEVTTTRYLLYPPPDDNSWVSSIQLRAEPGPSHGIDGAVPFYQGNQDFLVVLTVQLSVNGTSKNLMHFMSSQYLISLAKSGAVFVDWQWMLQRTRMCFSTSESEPSDVWVCYVYGTQFVILERAPDGKRRSAVRLYDFNQSAIRRDAQSSAKPDAPGSIEFLATDMTAGDPFRQKVSTSLPYWTNAASLEAVLAHDQQCQMMCSEDNIVIVDLISKRYTILVF